jgi:opacity protein-like surface antigen
MRTTGLTLLCLLVSPSCTFAADPPRWTGLYVGASAGAGTGIADGIPIGGGEVGGQIGVDLSLADRIRVGIRASGSVDGLEGQQTGVLPGGLLLFSTPDDNHPGPVVLPIHNTSSDALGASGSLVFRVGYDEGVWLPYAYAGIVSADNAATLSQLDTSRTLTEHQLHVGSAIGVGVESQVTERVSAFLEAERSDFALVKYNLGDDQLPLTISRFPLSVLSVRVGVNFHFH